MRVCGSDKRHLHAAQPEQEGRGQDDYTTIIKMIEGWAGVVVDGRNNKGT